MKRIPILVGLLIGLVSGAAHAQTRVAVSLSFADPHFAGQVVIGQPYYPVYAHRYYYRHHRYYRSYRTAPLIIVGEPRVVVMRPSRYYTRPHRYYARRYHRDE